MFDIGFFELLVIAVLGLLVIGPKRLPEVVRTVSLWVGRIRRSFNSVKRGIENEFQLDEVRRQLHNEEIMRQLNESKREIEQAVSAAEPSDHDYEPLPRNEEKEQTAPSDDPKPVDKA